MVAPSAFIEHAANAALIAAAPDLATAYIEAVERAERAERERDEARKTLWRIADYIEPHWRGAGANEDCEWLEAEITCLSGWHQI